MDHLKRRHVHAAEHYDLDARYHQVPLNDNEYPYYDYKDNKIHKPSRAYTKFLGIYLDNKQYIVTGFLTLLSFWTRFRIIDLSNKVVWDEAHFGKFGSYYLKHEFYFDVHPPLGKMLVGLSGWLAGYDGSFDFESGSEYPRNVNFASMRIFNAAWGALVVPIAYLTAQQFGMSMPASLLAATMVLCDTAYLCISRFILLDSMLLFFTCTTLYTLSCFHNTRTRPFSTSWWTWLALTGVSLGCVLSVKWVGLFAVALVGLYTLEDLWEMFGDLSMKKTVYLGHWIARSICLILIPATIYVLSFAAHFHILSKSGPGDANMSSLFQAHLEGNKLSESPIDVAYNSTVTIKNHAFGGGLLHSHVQTYPEGSKQQQVTTYSFKDANNLWSIQHAHDQGDIKEGDPIQFVKDGDVVRLVHIMTKQNLHSHTFEAPVTKSQYEVSGHGAQSGSTPGDDWRVEIIDKHDNIKSLMTRFRLRHVELGCLLAADKVHLPQWGFRQVEVTCDKDNRVNDHHTWWNIEEHVNERLPPPPMHAYKSNFFDDFKTLNAAMWLSNNALVADPDKDDILTSSPWQWPLTTAGLRMCSWGDKSIKFYLLGNPSVWWPSFVSVFVFLFTCAVYDVRARRQLCNLSLAHRESFLFVGKTLFLGWFLHYIPFFLMGRVTYLHHYFPALYFSILMVPFLIDHLSVSASSLTRATIFTLAFALVIANFVFFSPFAYGMAGPVKNYSNRRWLKSWNLIDTL